MSAAMTGVLVGAVGLTFLYLAAHAQDPATYHVGLVVFAFAILFEFWLLKRWFDDADRGT